MQLAARVWIAAILTCAAATACAQTGKALRYADDLTAIARQARLQRAPIMVVFTGANCRYCHEAKRDYLVPMQNSAEWRDKVIIREVDIDSSASLRDFEGQTLSHSEFSKRYQVKRVPTVIVMDDQGQPAASPIVGLIAADFYALYLQQAVEEGLIRLRGAQRQN